MCVYVCVCPARSLYMITLSVPRRRSRRRYRCRAYSGTPVVEKKSPTTAAKIIFVLDFHRRRIIHHSTLQLYLYTHYICIYRCISFAVYVILCRNTRTTVQLRVNCRRRGNITVRVYIILCGVSIYANKKKNYLFDEI